MDKAAGLIEGILSQNKWTLLLWGGLVVAFSGLCWWKYFCGVEVQQNLAIMTGTLWTALFTAINKIMGKVESATGLDIDKDGTVGTYTANATPIATPATIASVEVDYNAECDASKYLV